MSICGLGPRISRFDCGGHFEASREGGREELLHYSALERAPEAAYSGRVIWKRRRDAGVRRGVRQRRSGIVRHRLETVSEKSRGRHGLSAHRVEKRGAHLSVNEC